MICEVSYAVAVLHMLVLDEDRQAFYHFIRDHLKEDGIALICTMGDGIAEWQTDIAEAFEHQKRMLSKNGQEVMVAATSCRTVSFETFKKELRKSMLEISENGFTSRAGDFPQMMYSVVKR